MKLACFPDGSPEIFHTLQGEGVSAGTPAVFVRTSLCNLHCAWCDTDYTWNWEGTPWPHQRDNEPGYSKYRKEEQIVERDPAEVAAAIRDFPTRRLVLTGGEPLLQMEALRELIALLRRHDPGWQVEVETNGTITPSTEFDALVQQYNVSPKLANSGNAPRLSLAGETLAFFAASHKAWFKFVVAQPEDLDEIDQIRHRYGIPPDQTLLLPEGRDPKRIAERRLWLAEECLARGYRFSDRLHLVLWGDERGR